VAADVMVDRIAGQRAMRDPQQPTLAPGTAPRMHARQRAGADAISTRGEKP
jgi:hypothetical protein